MESELRKETEKWLGKIREEIREIEVLDKERDGMIENIRAYVKDCEYFLKGNDLIRAFESVIWAWSWIEILKELKIIRG
ncbi:MAG: DUF357 domain-containing protein [Candidatus Aenigmarchaeota archaeon]|nr:DUF357 domain-containing protein [Candidatus Aenigmarchaeota archaeon]NIP40182.1 DUF357 domain-containing protein [Candidatus Aenigmarchaeota archaeon]NIQ17219.1 DUF357 domain-containing protein [Candidatus Aenigmarchaeota archaeon]NIS73009.1 DUF357 domain-containing protein [Candidatus Aenigmarchaeota archaeon]